MHGPSTKRGGCKGSPPDVDRPSFFSRTSPPGTNRVGVKENIINTSIANIAIIAGITIISIRINIITTIVIIIAAIIIIIIIRICTSIIIRILNNIRSSSSSSSAPASSSSISYV